MPKAKAICETCGRELTYSGFCGVCNYGWSPEDKNEDFGASATEPSVPYTPDGRIDEARARRELDPVDIPELEAMLDAERNQRKH